MNTKIAIARKAFIGTVAAFICGAAVFAEPAETKVTPEPTPAPVANAADMAGVTEPAGNAPAACFAPDARNFNRKAFSGRPADFTGSRHGIQTHHKAAPARTPANAGRTKAPAGHVPDRHAHKAQGHKNRTPDHVNAPAHRNAPGHANTPGHTGGHTPRHRGRR